MTILLSWLIADFIAGTFHWWEDRYASDEWPIIGKYIAKPNQQHHANPVAFTRTTYWSRNWIQIAACLLVATPFYMLGLWLWPLLFLSQANEIHAWSHTRAPRAIRLLQETGILQSPKQHSEHHTGPHDKRYCVMSNWLNPFLDYFHFWYALEWCAYKLFGVTTNA